MEKGPIINEQNFTSALFHQSFQGTRADHMRARKVAAIAVRARKRPNWNLFRICPAPIIMMGPVVPHGNMPDACSKFGLAAGRRRRNQLKKTGARVATCDMPCASTVIIDVA